MNLIPFSDISSSFTLTRMGPTIWLNEWAKTWLGAICYRCGSVIMCSMQWWTSIKLKFEDIPLKGMGGDEIHLRPSESSLRRSHNGVSASITRFLCNSRQRDQDFTLINQLHFIFNKQVPDLLASLTDKSKWWQMIDHDGEDLVKLGKTTMHTKTE